MENRKASDLSLTSIKENREKEKECRHSFDNGELNECSNWENDFYLFNCKKCDYSEVVYFALKKQFLKLNKQKLFRLEFNESRQTFHLDNYTHQENTHGWFTICDVTDKDFKIIKSYLEIFKGKKTKEQMHLFINKLMKLIKQK